MAEQQEACSACGARLRAYHSKPDVPAPAWSQRPTVTGLLVGGAVLGGVGVLLALESETIVLTILGVLAALVGQVALAAGTIALGVRVGTRP